jgi:hypothetical protein
VGLITGILGLPLAPLRGTVAIAEQLYKQAEQELNDPSRVRAELEAVERARAAGEIDDEQAAIWEDELVARLIAGRRQPGRE